MCICGPQHELSVNRINQGAMSHLPTLPSDDELGANQFESKTARALSSKLIDSLLNSIRPPAFDTIIITCNVASRFNFRIVQFQVLLHVIVKMIAIDVDPIKVI